MSKLVSELRRRRVFKVATAYLIGGWIIVQAADILREPLEMDNWVFLTILGVVALGFVLTVALAWSFDLTAEGVKRTPGEAGDQIQTLSTGRKIDFFIIALLVVAVVGFATKDNWFQSARSGVGVAVLPFASMSSDQDNEYFSDGLSEELLNILANIDGFRVPGRTSVFYYKGRNVDLREIGEHLGVENILEGSVRRDGNRVRITAQLIRADDGNHIWSEIYDKNLDDIFGIQEDVARSVANALKVTLLGEDEVQLAERKTANPAAYNMYMVARSRQNMRGQENLVGARTLYEKIIAEHPDYAPAYSGLAESILLLANNHFYMTNEQAIDLAEPLIDKAVALAPDSAATWRAKGFYESQINQVETGSDEYFENAVTDYEKALALDPNDANTLYWYGILMDDAGHRDQAIELYQRSLEIDQLARVPRYRLGQVYEQLGQFDQARRAYEEVIELYPDYNAVIMGLANLEQNEGDFAEAERLMLRATKNGADANIWVSLFILYQNVGRPRDQIEAIERMEIGESGAYTEDAKGLLDAVMKQDQDAIVKYADALADSDNSTQQWLQVSATANLMGGNYARALSRIERLAPEFLMDPPQVSLTIAPAATLAAAILVQTGDTAQAAGLLDASQAALESGWPGDYKPVGVLYRLAEIAALRGDDDDAIALLNQAYDQGFRQAWFDVIYPMSENPLFGDLPSDPRFESLVSRILADATAQKASLTGLERS